MDNNRAVRWEFVLFLLLGALTFLVFERAMFFDFVAWDDPVLVYENPHLGGVDWARLHWMFTDVTYLWRYLPLTWLGWAINYDLGALDPFGYHLGNLLLHAANAGLVFLVIRKLFLPGGREEWTPARKNYLNLCAALGAALWAVHPLRAEPVVWVTDRVYCQALFFLLLASWCHLSACAQPEGSPGRRRFYWAGVILFAASLLSYQTGLGYVGVLVVLDVYPLRRFNPGWRGWWDARARRLWLEKVPFLVVSFLVVAVTLRARFTAPTMPIPPVGLDQFSAVQRLAQAFYIWAYYLWKPWLPLDLAPVYTTLLHVRLAEPRFLLSIAAVVALSALFVWKRRTWPGLLALWVCYLGLLVPVLGLTEHPHFSNDRYSYFAGVCWSVLLTAGLLRLDPSPGLRRAVFGFAAAATLLLSVLAHRQTGIWQNSVVLFEHIIAKLGDDPYRADIYWRLADAYGRAGQPQKALAAFEQFAALRPNDAATYRKIGESLYGMGLIAEARTAYETALRLKPDDARLHNGFGVMLGAQGQLDEAMKQFQEAARLNPALAGAWQNIGLVLRQQGKADEAKVYFEKADRLRQGQPPAAP